MIRIVVKKPHPTQAGQPLNFDGLVWHNEHGIVGHAIIQQEVTVDIVTDDGIVKQSEWRDIPMVLDENDG